MDNKKGRPNGRLQTLVPLLFAAFGGLFFAPPGLSAGDRGVWKARLTPIRFSVLRGKKTEDPFLHRHPSRSHR
jgi:hypothetical protein